MVLIFNGRLPFQPVLMRFQTKGSAMQFNAYLGPGSWALVLET